MNEEVEKAKQQWKRNHLSISQINNKSYAE